MKLWNNFIKSYKEHEPFSSVLLIAVYAFLLIDYFNLINNSEIFNGTLAGSIALIIGWVNYHQNKVQFEYQKNKEMRFEILDYLNNDYKTSLISDVKKLIIGKEGLLQFENKIVEIQNVKISHPNFYTNMQSFFAFYDKKDISKLYCTSPYFVFSRLKHGVEKSLSIKEYHIARILLGLIQDCHDAFYNSTINYATDDRIKPKIDEIESYYRKTQDNISFITSQNKN